MRRRNKQIIIRLTDNEYKRLKRNVEKTGLTMQAYFQMLMKNIQPIERPSMDLLEVLKNLQQINNNMNQVAVKANAKGFVDTAAYWENVNWLQETVSQLIMKMNTRGN